MAQNSRLRQFSAVAAVVRMAVGRAVALVARWHSGSARATTRTPRARPAAGIARASSGGVVPFRLLPNVGLKLQRALFQQARNPPDLALRQVDVRMLEHPLQQGGEQASPLL